MTDDWYRVLQIQEYAEPEVVTAAYRALSRKYHPDVSGAPDAPARQRLINAAFAVLGDVHSRSYYDRTIGRVDGIEMRSQPLDDWRWNDGRKYVHNSSVSDLMSGGTMHVWATGSTFTECGWDARSWRRVQAEEEFWASRPCLACVKQQRKAA